MIIGFIYAPSTRYSPIMGWGGFFDWPMATVLAIVYSISGTIHIVIHTVYRPTGASDLVAAAAAPGEVGIAVREGGDGILSAAMEGQIKLLHMMA